MQGHLVNQHVLIDRFIDELKSFWSIIISFFHKLATMLGSLQIYVHHTADCENDYIMIYQHGLLGDSVI